MNARDGAPGDCTVGVDIGGTKTLGVAIGPRGEALAEVRRPSGHGPGGVVDAVVDVLRRLADELPGRRVARVGIGIPGTVDHRDGRVRQALNLGIDSLPLRDVLAARLGVPVHVENDVNVAALGVATLPGAPRSLAYLNLGTGLAVGVVLEGRLWRGASGAAGEIGHIPIDPAGAECVCGLRGCLELYASGSGIARQWGEDVPMIAAIQALADDGDPRAADVIGRLVAAVAAAVRLVQLTHDVERVVLGGGIATVLGDRLLDPVRQTLRGWEAGSAFLASLAASERTVLTPPGVPVAALGAAQAANRSPDAAVPGQIAEAIGG